MHKTLPCRHFDVRTGKALGQGCSKGDICQFLHPNDPGWKHVGKEKPAYPKGPLASQSHLFQRHQRERSLSPVRGRQNRRASLVRRGMKAEDSSRPNIRGPRIRYTPDNKPNSGRMPQVRDEFNATMKAESKQVGLQEGPQEVIGNKGGQQKNNMKHDCLSKEPRSEEIWNAFSRIARFSRESDMLQERQKSEESKIATYTAMEETLNKISNQMGEMVNPQIRQSILAQEDCKKAIKENQESIRKIWGEAVQAFVADVTREMDGHMQIALQNMRNEAKSMSTNDGIMLGTRTRSLANLNSVAGPLRKEVETQTMICRDYSPQDVRDGGYKAMTRRGRAPSSLSQDQSPGKTEKSLDVIQELKNKIEQQTQALAMLTKENEELRANARKPDPLSPSTPLRETTIF